MQDTLRQDNPKIQNPILKSKNRQRSNTEWQRGNQFRFGAGKDKLHKKVFKRSCTLQKIRMTMKPWNTPGEKDQTGKGCCAGFGWIKTQQDVLAGNKGKNGSVYTGISGLIALRWILSRYRKQMWKNTQVILNRTQQPVTEEVIPIKGEIRADRNRQESAITKYNRAQTEERFLIQLPILTEGHKV